MTALPARLDMRGLTTGPSQLWGSIRLVPLLRAQPVSGLRLDARIGGADVTVVALGPRLSYLSYIPHGYVATWHDDDAAVAAYGTQIRDPQRRVTTPSGMRLSFQRRMARKVAKNRLRFLPLHLAVEGYLSLHFGGPELAWAEWSQRAIRRGLSPRVEESYRGDQIAGLADALRVFEIHRGQCGVLLYVADALASAFVVPHPDDYRALHPTLILDLFGELIHQYGLMTLPVSDYQPRLAADRVSSLADLRAEVGRHRAGWEEFHDSLMMAPLLTPAYHCDTVQRLGPFSLWRFRPPFDRVGESHIGEAISDADGRLAYLKTFRLSDAQVRRGYLLTQLAAHDWQIDATAAALNTDARGLALRLDRAGFGYLIRQDMLDHYRAKARDQRRRSRT